MEGITCDRCGNGLLLDEDVRYLLRVEIRAAYDPLEITRQDLERDLEAEIRETIAELEDLDPVDAERQVHYEGHFDLCGRCQREILADPLFRPRRAH